MMETNTDFWQSFTIEELAERQGIVHIQDVRVFFGTWPGEKDDGFEEDIRNLRQSGEIGIKPKMQKEKNNEY